MWSVVMYPNSVTQFLEFPDLVVSHTLTYLTLLEVTGFQAL